MSRIVSVLLIALWASPAFAKKKQKTPTISFEGKSAWQPKREFSTPWDWSNATGNTHIAAKKLRPVIRASSSLKKYPVSNVWSDKWMQPKPAHSALGSAWCDGQPGAGIGEWVEFQFPKRVTLTELHFAPGYAKSVDTLKKNNQVKRMTLFLDGKQVVRFVFPRQTVPRGSLVVRFGSAHSDRAIIAALASRAFRTMRLVINEVHRGSEFNDTCISAIIPGVVPAD